MRRFWLDEKYKAEDVFLIEGEKFKHICGVCRMEEGAKFEILVGDGKAHFCELLAPEKKQALAKILESRELPELPKPYIDLYLSVPKFSKMEWIIEKSVELGVRSIVPVLSDYSFVKKEQMIYDKMRRFNKIVEGATQQSARATKMQIEKPISLDAALEKINQNDDLMGLFAYEGDSKLGLKQALREPKYRQASQIAILVGSEGGFSQEELKTCQKAGLDPVSLGSQVLRVETACVTLISVLKYEMELFDWT
jgi:16S rRNA (uracil1498-N3)-methyltransferase